MYIAHVKAEELKRTLRSSELCPHCRKKVPNLDEHIKNQHSISCSKCGQRFRDHQSWKHHMRDLHGLTAVEATKEDRHAKVSQWVSKKAKGKKRTGSDEPKALPPGLFRHLCDLCGAQVDLAVDLAGQGLTFKCAIVGRACEGGAPATKAAAPLAAMTAMATGLGPMGPVPGVAGGAVDVSAPVAEPAEPLAEAMTDALQNALGGALDAPLGCQDISVVDLRLAPELIRGSSASTTASCRVDEFIRAQELQQSPRSPVRACAPSDFEEGGPDFEMRLTDLPEALEEAVEEEEEEGSHHMARPETTEPAAESSEVVAVCILDPEVVSEQNLQKLYDQARGAATDGAAVSGRGRRPSGTSYAQQDEG
eukprot:s74_g22.t1